MKEQRRLRIGVLGSGPDRAVRALRGVPHGANAELYAVCDVAEDLLQRAAQMHEPRKLYAKLR